MRELPVKIIFWKNKTVIAFNENGKQMPAWQGSWLDIFRKLSYLSEREFGEIKFEFNKVWRA